MGVRNSYERLESVCWPRLSRCSLSTHTFFYWANADNIIATGIRYTLVRLVRARSNPIYKSLCYVRNERGTFFNRRPQSCLQFLGQKSLALIIVGELKHVVACLLIAK